LRAEGGLAKFLWDFVDGRPVQNNPRSAADIPAQTETSKRMAKALGGRGFRFCGPTICYALMQAVGMVNDHAIPCFRHAELANAARSWEL
jgi:DNA-3-methyladenine glycosylase I